MCIYIYIYRERERDRLVMLIVVCYGGLRGARQVEVCQEVVGADRPVFYEIILSYVIMCFVPSLSLSLSLFIHNV